MSNRQRNPYQDHPVLGKHPDRELTNNEIVKLFSELFKYYGIRDPIDEDVYDALSKLALNLAMEFVPAFQPKKKRGPKRQWLVSEMIVVRDTVNRIKSKFPLLKHDEIFKEMSALENYKDMGVTAGAIKGAYHRICNVKNYLAFTQSHLTKTIKPRVKHNTPVERRKKRPWG